MWAFLTRDPSGAGPRALKSKPMLIAASRGCAGLANLCI